MNITFQPGKGIRIPESKECLLLKSGIREFYLVESGILGFGIRNYSSRKPESLWPLESGIQVPLTKNPESRIQNPRLSWIPSQEVNIYLAFLKNHTTWCRRKIAIGTRKTSEPSKTIPPIYFMGKVGWELSRSVDSLTSVLYTAWINWKTSKWSRV